LTGDGLIVNDVDVKNGKDGLNSLLELDLPLDTLTVRTPSGGMHLYYKGPPVANSAGKLGEGLDVRGYHGYVVAPGSIVGGGRYILASTDSRDSGCATLNPVLISVLGAPPAKRLPNGVDVELDDPAAVEHARGWLEQQPGAVEGNGGDAHTYRTAARLKDFGISEGVACDLLAEGWNERCSPVWEPSDLRTKVANAYAYGTSPLGSQSPQHLFAGVDVPPDHRPALPNDGWFDRDDDWLGSVEWLYHDVFTTTGVCVLTAPSNAGKTFVALDLAESLALQRPFFGVEPEHRGATLLLIGEAYGSLKMRMQALAPGIPVSATYVGALAARGALEDLGKRMKAKCAKVEAEHGCPVRLIILDTLSSSGILEKEDDNAQAASVMRAFNDLSTMLKAFVIIIHHPPKSGEGERGASAIRNNADYVLTIRREGTSAVREIEITKSRDAETKALGTFTLVPHQIGEDAKGREIKTMRISAGEPRIREIKDGSEHAPLAVEVVEWTEKDAGAVVGDEMWAPREIAKVRFVERRGIGAAAAVRQFNEAVRRAIDMGALKACRKDGEEFLKTKGSTL
jgi:hypothetical protein